MKEKIETLNAPAASGPFSQAIRSGSFMFTSGQIYLTPEGKLLEGTIEEKTQQIMTNLAAILESVGLTFENVVKTTIYVTDMSFYKSVNATYGSYLSEPYPARETVCVKELPLGAEIEISMIACQNV